MKVKPKKSLGQHFLKDKATAMRIAGTISPDQLPASAQRWGALPVVEVGPGMGMLTQFLINRNREVAAVEIDSESVEYLHAEMPQLKVVEGDFLKLDTEAFGPGEHVLIGNYPYNISSQIFFKVLDDRDKWPVVAGMLQREVAQRICAGPGSKVYGILSVFLRAWYDCEYLFSVPPDVFAPPPKVTSGVLRLTRNSRTDLGCDEARFRTVVKTAFGQRRKTLRNSLATLLGKDNPILQEEIMTLRPERLDVEDFVKITNAIPE